MSATLLATPVQTAAAPPARRIGIRAAWLAGLAVALLATFRVWVDPTHLLIGLPSDQEQYTWFLAWLPHALSHGLNPLETHLANAPYGANLMWNTALLTAGLLLWPVTATAGPVFACNLLLFGCLAANVPAAYLLTRRLAGPTRTALALAVGYGICPFVGVQAVEHVNFALAAFPPVLLALLYDLLTGARSPRRTGVLVGLLSVAQLLYGEEELAITALGLALAVLWLVARQRVWLRAQLRRLATAGGTAVAVALPLVAPFLAWQFFGPQRIHPPLYPSNRYSIDLTNLALPTPAAMLHVVVSPVVWTWSGGVVEADGYLLPLVLLLLACRRRWRGNPVAATALAVGVTAALLALGTPLHFAGQQLPVPGLALLLRPIPVLSQIVVTRLTLLCWLAGLVILAVAASGPAAPRGNGAYRFAGLALGVALLAPSWPIAVYYAVLPTGFTGARAAVHPGDTVEFAPTTGPGVAGNPMLWQALTGFDWRMYTTYLISPQEEHRVHGGYSKFPCLDTFIGYTNSYARLLAYQRLACPANLRAELLAAGITVLVDGPSGDQGYFGHKIRLVLGPPQRIGDLFVWRLRPPTGAPAEQPARSARASSAVGALPMTSQ